MDIDCTPLELLSSNYSGGQYSSNTLFSYGVVRNSSLHKTVNVPFTSLDPDNLSYHLDEHLENDDDNGYTKSHEIIESVLYTHIIMVICVLGIVGNILNLIVLTRKSLQKTMDRMEKSAHYGLVSMASSDMLFCIVVLPHAWVPQKKFMFENKGFELYYTLYSEGMINIFIMSSTLLTVTIATSRYLAIVHPLQAREIIGMTFAKGSIALVFIVCILFNLPRFWSQSIETMQCAEGYSVYFTKEGFMKENKTFETIYMWIYFLCGILAPLLWLTYCNIYLIRALKQSARMRAQYQPNNSSVSESTHRITLTLIVIVVMYIILVSPAELVNFLKDMVIADSQITPSYNVAVAILNTFQAINFSFNFILYCVINVHFRKTVTSIFCYCRQQKKDKITTTTSGWYESVSATTQV